MSGTSAAFIQTDSMARQLNLIQEYSSKMDCADLDFWFLVRMWRIIEWVSRVWHDWVLNPNPVENSRERTWS